MFAPYCIDSIVLPSRSHSPYHSSLRYLTMPSSRHARALGRVAASRDHLLAPYTPETTAERTGLQPELVYDIARTLASAASAATAAPAPAPNAHRALHS